MDYDGKNDTEEYSVGSRTETMNYKDYDGIMKGTNLKDYLNKSAAYAEITVDADGKLTDVMFMDQKGNDTNTVIGNYYQVSRKVITDVNEGKWISTYNGVATYASEDALYSIDTKNSQTVASDFADEVFYYTIDGKPTNFDGYKSSPLDILAAADKNGTQKTNFDGNPDISVAEASDLQVSDIRNDADSANDTYYVADIASKIANDGKGDVTAVYMFEDDMDEVINFNGSASVAATNVKVGEKTTVKVTLADDDNIDKSKLYVDVVDAKGKVVLSEVKVSVNKDTEVDTSKLEAGTYTVKLYGYNDANKEYQFLKDTQFVVSKLGAAGDVDLLTLKSLDAQTIEVTAKEGDEVVEDLKASDFTVKVDGALMAASEYTVTEMGNGVYQIRADKAFASGATVAVSVGDVKDVEIVVNEAEDYTYDLVFDSNAAVWTGKITLTIEVDGKSTQIELKDLTYTNQYGDAVAQNMVGQLNKVGGNVFSAKMGENGWTVHVTSSKELQIYSNVTNTNGTMVVTAK